MIQSTVARRYAKGALQAVLQLNLPNQGPDRVAGDLATLAATVAEHRALERMILNPAIDARDKAAVIDEVADRLGCGTVARKLLAVLAGNERLDHLAAVAESLRRLVDDHLGVIDAEVTTPVPLSERDLADLTDKLAGVTGRTVRLRARTDPRLLGGLVTRIGDMIYDGSLLHQLARIRGRMIEG